MHAAYAARSVGAAEGTPRGVRDLLYGFLLQLLAEGRAVVAAPVALRIMQHGAGTLERNLEGRKGGVVEQLGEQLRVLGVARVEELMGSALGDVT